MLRLHDRCDAPQFVPTLPDDQSVGDECVWSFILRQGLSQALSCIEPDRVVVELCLVGLLAEAGVDNLPRVPVHYREEVDRRVIEGVPESARIMRFPEDIPRPLRVVRLSGPAVPLLVPPVADVSPLVCLAERGLAEGHPLGEHGEVREPDPEGPRPILNNDPFFHDS